MIIDGIDTGDISVVVQGAIDKTNTRLCIKSIRKYFPEAEIILSTWEDSDLTGLEYDKVLLNKDPGGWNDGNTNVPNNLNRQILSTKNGLHAAKNKYCIKMRSDLIFKSHDLLSYFDKFPKREEAYSVFSERIIFCSYFFKRYIGTADTVVQPVPFHLSDWFAFGLREDLLRLFDIPLADEPDNVNYFINNEVISPKTSVYITSHQYAPEQYILIRALAKTERLPRFNHYLDYTAENIEYSNRVIANNCIILNPSQIQIYCGKNGMGPYKKWTQNENTLPYEMWEGLYRFDVFEQQYRKYCCPEYQLSQEGIQQVKKYLRFRRMFHIGG